MDFLYHPSLARSIIPKKPDGIPEPDSLISAQGHPGSDGGSRPADEDSENGDDQHSGAQHQSRHPLDGRLAAVCDLDLQSIKSRRKGFVYPFESRFVFRRMPIHTFLQ